MTKWLGAALGAAVLACVGQVNSAHASSVQLSFYANDLGLDISTTVTLNFDERYGGSYYYTVYDPMGVDDPFGDKSSAGSVTLNPGRLYFSDLTTGDGNGDFTRNVSVALTDFNFTGTSNYYSASDGYLDYGTSVSAFGAFGLAQGYAGSYGTSFDVTFTPSPVPLPSSLPLFGLALAGLGVYARRSRRSLTS